MARLKDILQQQRKLNFVGRQEELAFFDSLIKAPHLSLHLLYIWGSGGQGKTTLLKEFADQCKTACIPFIQLDCRNISAHPDSFRQSFKNAAPFTGSDDMMSAIEDHGGTVVLLIDTYEKIKPLDDWLRISFLPELPANVLTIIAGRSPLSTNWKADPGWQSITKLVPLHELNIEESKQLLGRRNIPPDQLDRIVAFAHGNPLALSIIADMFDQKKNSRLPGIQGQSIPDPLDSPDVMKKLLDQFVQEVPSPAHRAALELCSLVNMTTEKMIEEVLGPQGATELFNWLTTLTIIEKGPGGIYPHDLARDAIATELHWRNPEWYRHLHIKTQQYYISRLIKQSGEKQRALLFGLIFLHRMNPAVRHFFEFQETGSTWQDVLRGEDRPHLVAMVKKYEGTEAAHCLEKWLNHPAAETWIFRGAEKPPAGFVLKINMEKIGEETHDPVINRIFPYRRKWNIRDGQLFTAFRSWMSRDQYQNVSDVQSAIFLSIVQWYFTPGLAVSMLHCAHPEFWKQILEYADLTHLEELDHEMNGKPYGWYMHDWRDRPPLDWLGLMGKKEINEEEIKEEAPALPGKVITEEKFVHAVHEALKQIKNPRKLTDNILIKSKFVSRDNETDPTPVNLAFTLADKLARAIASLEHSPKDESLHRVLYRTFINPVGNQEQTADFLYMSFSTYRRQVKKGVERIADILWVEELKQE